jgi:hypothetical protein
VQIVKALTILFVTAYSQYSCAQSTEMHAGHGGGGDDVSCIKAKISHFKPEHLAIVAPGSDFSFTVSGSNGPGHIHVSVRQQPVDVSVENKEAYYLVKGKLPEGLKNEVVRVSVKAKAKVSKCDADSGWLLKVGD